MKIIILGNMWKSICVEITDECKIRDAFKRLGHEVIEYNWYTWRDEKEKILQDNLGASFVLAAKRLTAEQVVEMQERLKIPIFYWMFDLIYSRSDPWATEAELKDGHFAAALAADGYFSKELSRAQFYRDMGVKFFYLPCDSAGEDYYRKEIDDKERERLNIPKGGYDVIFTGGHGCWGDAERAVLLREIQDLIKPTILTIFGHNPGGWKSVGLEHARVGLWDWNYGKLIPLSKITLAIDSTHSFEGFWSNRVGKILMCGGFCLMKYTVGMERACGPDKEHVVYWNTAEECVEKIRYYLKHEDERQEIADRAYEFGRKFFSMDYRVRQLLTILEYKYGIKD